jgi:hypothetical protein
MKNSRRVLNLPIRSTISNRLVDYTAMALELVEGSLKMLNSMSGLVFLNLILIEVVNGIERNLGFVVHILAFSGFDAHQIAQYHKSVNLTSGSYCRSMLVEETNLHGLVGPGCGVEEWPSTIVTLESIDREYFKLTNSGFVARIYKYSVFCSRYGTRTGV